MCDGWEAVFVYVISHHSSVTHHSVISNKDVAVKFCKPVMINK